MLLWQGGPCFLPTGPRWARTPLRTLPLPCRWDPGRCDLRSPGEKGLHLRPDAAARGPDGKPGSPSASSRPLHLRNSPPVLPPAHLQLPAQLLSGLWFLGPGVTSSPLSAPHSASPPPAPCTLRTSAASPSSLPSHVRVWAGLFGVHFPSAPLPPAGSCSFVAPPLWLPYPLPGSATPPPITQVPLLFKCLVVCDLGQMTLPLSPSFLI